MDADFENIAICELKLCLCILEKGVMSFKVQFYFLLIISEIKNKKLLAIFHSVLGHFISHFT